MAYKEIKTEIRIKATLEKVWEVLMDFENYHKWNPFIRSIKGTTNRGDMLNVQIAGMTFKPRVLVCEKHKEFRWLGKLWFKGLFDGEHSFELHREQNGWITFKQEEKFNGILVGLFSKKLDGETLDGFKAMNEKLKALAEKE